MRFLLNGAEAVFHRPHPRPETNKGAVTSAREFLQKGGRDVMTTLSHDGYIATVEIDEEANIMHGRVVNARAVLTFEGETLAELRAAFGDTIADYRDWCAERGVEPEKPYSGNISLRIPPELHRRIAQQAAKVGESLNQFIVEQLSRGA